MRIYFSLIAGVLALGTEILVFMALMEIPPFGEGSDDVIWGLPFFGLITLGLSAIGLASAIRARADGQGKRGLVMACLILNGLSLAVPVLLLIIAVGRALLFADSADP